MPVWRMTVKSTGASSTRPTWKKTGRPIRKPESSSASRAAARRARETSALETTTAPPDSASSLPITVPRPMTSATKPERVADALLEGARDVGQRHPRAEPDDHRSDQQRDERRQAQPGDEQHHEGDAERGDQQESRGIRGSHGASA